MFNPNQTKVDLSKGNLESLPGEIFKLKNLQKLSLKNNQIRNVPIDIIKLKRLENIDLSNNKIEYLYAKFFQLTNLKVLVINNNSLRLIPKQIGKLNKLKILSISSNNIKKLPDEIGQLLMLEELNISKNQFTSFPECILKLRNLKALWLSDNIFEDFPTQLIIEKMTSLQKIYCYGANLENMPNVSNDFFQLSKIKGNSIQFLKNNVVNMSNKFHKGTNSKFPQYSSTVESLKNTLLSGLGSSLLPLNKIKIFISYSREDKGWMPEIRKHLKVLNYENDNLDVWDDSRIEAGQDWKVEIEKSLAECQIAILLISTDFLASDFIRKNELPPILSAATDKGIVVLPLIVGHSRFLNIPSLSKYHAINEPLNPLSDLSKGEVTKVLVKMTDQIASIIAKI